VIRLGLRLSIAGGRESLSRFILIVVAVAIGVELLLATLAGLHAVTTQNARYGWLETGYSGSDAPASAPGRAATPGVDPVWWRLRADYFQGRQIGRVDVAATGPTSPTPPGIPALPAPGQFYASPKLVGLLNTNPAAALRDRYPGTLVGTIGAAALPSPDSLIIVIGRRPADLSHDRRARLEQRISTTAPSRCNGDCAPGVGTNANGLVLILSVATAALLFPVLIFVGAATRLSATRREQRFAAMRLIGATPAQVATIATAESTVAAVIGVSIGFMLFLAMRPLIALIPFTGERFFTRDIAPSSVSLVVVVLGVPVASAVASRLALRRVAISPLGVSRRATPAPPRARRILPLLAGLAELGYFAYVHNIGANTHTNTTLEAAAFLVGVLLVMTGLVVAGPWLTLIASRLVANRANRPAALLAARRLEDNPHAGFRAVSGVVLAMFVGTCAVGIITTINAPEVGSHEVGTYATGTLVDVLASPDRVPTGTALPASVSTDLDATPGVTGIAVIHDAPQTPPKFPGPGAGPGVRMFQTFQQVVSCAQLRQVPALGHCPAGATTAAINPDYGGGFELRNHRTMAETRWPPSNLTSSQLNALPIDTVVVSTNGSTPAVEHARTVLDAAYPTAFAAETITEIHADRARLLRDYQQLANVVILTSLPIAGISLTVSIAGGLIERRRPFSLLRLAGTPLATLRRVIGLEAAAPLFITAAASIAAAFLSAQLFLRAQLDESLHHPAPGYFVVIAAGLTAAMLVIASAFPLLRRATGPDAARND
jgi:hypothetical protein